MNINNIINLIKAYFYENWQKDVIYNFVIMMAISLFSVLTSPFNMGTIFLVAFVLIIYYPCRVFSNLHRPSSRIHYLMIPATNSEKVVTGMLLANVYYVVGIVLSTLIGLVLGCVILNIVKPGVIDISIYELIKNTFPTSNALYILIIYSSIAAMFFAAIYFKKSPFWKLMLTGFIVTLVFGAIMAGTEWLNVLLTVPAEIRNGNYYKVEHSITTSNDWFPYVVCCVTIVYFYAMSFLRMRETEA